MSFARVVAQEIDTFRDWVRDIQTQWVGQSFDFSTNPTVSEFLTREQDGNGASNHA